MDNPFSDLRPGVRARLLAVVDHLRKHGEISRADIVRIGEVHPNQATTDLKTIMDRMPGLMRYDASLKRYVLTGANPQPVRGNDLAALLARWADRHREDKTRLRWIADVTGLPDKQVQRLLKGQRSSMEPLLRKFVALHEECAGK